MTILVEKEKMVKDGYCVATLSEQKKKKKKNFILFSLLGEILAGILRVCIVRL